MAIKRKRYKLGSNSLPEPPEITHCRDAINKAVDSPGLSLRESINGSFLEYQMTSRAAVQISEEEPMVLVIPFVNLLETTYWLGIHFRFKLGGREARFQTASMLIARSALAGLPKKKVLRAEWHQFEEPEQRGHAQPHWHIYHAEVDGGGLSSGDSVVHFHLAMASSWHLGLGQENSHCQEPSPKKLADWIQRCAGYTRAQLEYISTKYPDRSL